jgi:hypothetical protein
MVYIQVANVINVIVITEVNDNVKKKRSEEKRREEFFIKT